MHPECHPSNYYGVRNLGSNFQLPFKNTPKGALPKNFYILGTGQGRAKVL